ncbi:inositol monophosphatase family protein [Streptomyces atratus]|uniref:inositol monophosphatase family protein n=1 Tax=Streptomyces atratus TaxID=1893 RepID=UPI0033F1CB41
MLDPIDGTMYFARGAPMYAVSLAYVRDDVPLVGVVDAPVLGRRWTTPGRPESARPVAEDVRRAVVGVSGTGSGRSGARRVLDRVQDEAYRFRMQGSMALDLVGVAEGWLDACVCIAPKPWDVAAGVALCRERGRAVLGADGTVLLRLAGSAGGRARGGPVARRPVGKHLSRRPLAALPRRHAFPARQVNARTVTDS